MTDAVGDIGGSIRVTLRPRNGLVEAVDIASTRPTEAARIFVGKPVGEMCARIGRVFSLCGKAQTVAALRASEQALGIAPAPGVEAARDLAVQSEMLTQTTMRLALHWPRVLGLDLRPDLVRACLLAEADIERLALGPDWRVPGADLGAPGVALRAVMLDLNSALQADDLFDILRVVLAERGLSGFGALPSDQAPEAGAFSRCWDVPEVAEARAAHGPGLAARLAASRVEFESLPCWMRSKSVQISEEPARAPTRKSGQGEAVVETARGPLVHRLELDGGIVTSCVTEAPTEANFTPTGAVAAGLQGAVVDPVAAELHVLSVDPCVGCTVEIADA